MISSHPTSLSHPHSQETNNNGSEREARQDAKTTSACKPDKDSTTMAGEDVHCLKVRSNSSSRPRRLFVGDSVEVIPKVACSVQGPKLLLTAPKRAHSAIGDANDTTVTTRIVPDSVQTTGARSTDSIVSSSSSDGSRGLKRKVYSQPSSSSSSLTSAETNTAEPPKMKRQIPLFKQTRNIKLRALGIDCESTKALPDTSHKGCGIHRNANHQNNEQSKAEVDWQISVQHILFLSKQRVLEAQSQLSLSQLKRQAREKARVSSKATQRKQPKRKKKSRHRKPMSPPPSSVSETTEPMEEIQMNTGTLYLFRGENPRAKFVRGKY